MRPAARTGSSPVLLLLTFAQQARPSCRLQHCSNKSRRPAALPATLVLHPVCLPAFTVSRSNSARCCESTSPRCSLLALLAADQRPRLLLLLLAAARCGGLCCDSAASLRPSRTDGALLAASAASLLLLTQRSRGLLLAAAAAAGTAVRVARTAGCASGFVASSKRRASRLAPAKRGQPAAGRLGSGRPRRL